MIQRVAIVVVLVALAGFSLGAGPVDAASIFWANAVSGDWSDSTNWNPQLVPGVEDIAFINLAGTYTVTMDVDANILRFSVGASSGVQTLVMSGRVCTISSATAATVVLGGVLQMTGGSQLTGTSSINNLAEVQLDNSSVDVNFSNGGDLIVGGTSSIAGTFTTNSSSIITIGAGSLAVSGSFNNSNVIYMTGDGAGLSVTTGTLTNLNGSVINVSGAGAGRTLGAELVNEGVISVSADLTLLKADADHVNDGSINCFGGSLTVTQSGTTPSFTNNGGIIVSSGQSATATGGSFTNAATGTISGAGSLVVSTTTFSNAGIVSPGLSPGILTVTGNYSQTASGTLEIEIGGTTVGTGYDRLATSGAATLGGTLDLSLLYGFFPVDGDTFVVMTYSSVSGAFADTSSLDLGGGMKLIQDYRASELVLLAYQEPDVVVPIDPGICITPDSSCLTVPFYFQRLNTDLVRGYEVTFGISSELELCDGMNSIVEGPFLKNYCGGGSCTVFQKRDNGDGTYTINASILGATCGPDSSGTLFTVDVTHAGSDGTGSVSCDSVRVVDCSGGAVAGGPGGQIAIGIDVAYPPVVSDMAGTQIKSGNDADGTTGITVTWTGDLSGHLVEVFRKGYGDYPEYDAGAVPAVPTDPADALANGWTLTAIQTSGEVDDPPARDYWYYIMFATSDCALTSVSNMSGGTLNYHLGDVSDGITQCDGDNEVTAIDISFLGAHYFATGAGVDSVNCLDVGPTSDYTVDGLPQTDNEIAFDDLIMFAINYGTVGAPRTQVPVSIVNTLAEETPALALSVDPISPGESILTARLSLSGNQATVKGLHSVIDYDRDQMVFIGVSRGELIKRQSGNIFFKHLDTEEGIWLDAAMLGQDLVLEGSGDVAVLHFRTEAANTHPRLIEADLRDLNNRLLLDQEADSDQVLDEQPSRDSKIPGATQLLGARPNPFAGSTSIYFNLSSEANVSVDIFDVGGRLVRSLVNQHMTAGEHSILWDGKSDRGQTVSTGIYMYNFRAGSMEKTQKLFIFR